MGKLDDFSELTVRLSTEKKELKINASETSRCGTLWICGATYVGLKFLCL